MLFLVAPCLAHQQHLAVYQVAPEALLSVLPEGDFEITISRGVSTGGQKKFPRLLVSQEGYMPYSVNLNEEGERAEKNIIKTPEP